MSVARRLAYRLLNSVVRHVSPNSQDWASAMLRELDFVESDWGALLWALGSVTALFRHSVPRQLRARLEERFGTAQGGMLKNIRKMTAGMLWGVIIASVVLTISLLGLVGAVGIENNNVRNPKDLRGMARNAKSMKRNNEACKGILIAPSKLPRFSSGIEILTAWDFRPRP